MYSSRSSVNSYSVSNVNSRATPEQVYQVLKKACTNTSPFGNGRRCHQALDLPVVLPLLLSLALVVGLYRLLLFCAGSLYLGQVKQVYDSYLFLDGKWSLILLVKHNETAHRKEWNCMRL